MDADDRMVFRTNVVPFITPDIISGYAFAFVLSLNENIGASMTVGLAMEMLPIKICNASRYGYTPSHGVRNGALRCNRRHRLRTDRTLRRSSAVSWGHISTR